MKKLSDRSKNQIRKFLEAEGVAIGNQEVLKMLDGFFNDYETWK